MDVLDIHGDTADKIKTIPMIIGEKITAILGFSLLLIGITILFPLVLNLESLFVTILFIMMFVVVFASVALWHDGGSIRRFFAINPLCQYE